MSTTSPPIPGSARAVVDVVVKVVSEGRYRYGRLHLLQHAQREDLDEVVVLVNEATAVPEMPLGFTPAAVIQSGKPHDLPGWLEADVDDEIIRICTGAPVGSSDPTRLVARMVAAICIDVNVDNLVAAARSAADHSDTEVPAAAHSRMVHLEAPQVIDLAEELGVPDPDSVGRR